MIEPISTLGGVALAWAWEQWGKDWAEKSVGIGQQKWQQFNWRKAAEQYRQHLLHEHGTMRIFGMPEPIPLEDIFAEAYLLEEQQAHRRYNPADLATEFKERRDHDPHTRRHALQLVTQKPRLYILGKPGAGKTTFLKYVTVRACQQQLDKIPIMVVLRDWVVKQTPDLMSYMVKEFALCGLPEAAPFLEHILASGRAMVLFDGLDEVSPEHELRLTLIKQIEDFMRQYGACTYLLTCRVAADEYFFEKLTYVEMADFSKTQIETFIKKWFQQQPRKLAIFEPQFWADENKGLQDLAKNPLMLTLLCLSFEETMTLFKRRVAIYDKAIDTILDKWDSSRAIKRAEIYKHLDTLRKKQLFAKLAAHYFWQNKLVLPQAELISWLEQTLQSPGEQPNGAAILREIEHQHGLLIERAEKLYTFVHLTFQEYFTAYFLYQKESRWQKWLTTEIIADKRWREVILFVAALQDDANDFVLQFQAQANTLITADPALLRLFQWADSRALSLTDTALTIGDKRLAYLDVGLIAHALAHTSTLASVRSLARTSVLAHALVLARVLALARVRARNHDFDLVLDLVLDLARTIDIDRDLNLVSVELGQLSQHLFLWLYSELFAPIHPKILTAKLAPQISEYMAWWQEVGASSDNTAWQGVLKSLTPPAPESPSEAWQPIAKALRQAIISQLAIPELQLDTAQVERLNDYYAAMSLLDECLEVASVSVAVRQQLEDGRFKVA